MFEPAFREAEERFGRRRSDGEQTSFIPTSESAFMESVAQTSVQLAAALERIQVAGEVMTARQQALVLEKLAGAPEREEEVPDGL
jgi:hypothetical protein